MARFSSLILVLALLVALVAAQVAGRGHDAVAKRKRAPLDESDDAKRALDLSARSGKKACVAWSNSIPSALQHVASHKPFGMYTWSPWCPDQTYGIPCFPMLSGWRNAAKFKALGHKGFTHALHTNEPNQPGAGNMSPGSAAQLWREYFTPLHKYGIKLISPAPSNARSGVPWLQQFFKNEDIRNQTYAAALHWYGIDSKNFISYMENAHKELGGMKIWVTEVSCANFGGSGGQCNSGMAWKLMEEIKAWMDETWYIETYCWFGMFHGARAGVPAASQLLNGNGTLSPLGNLFYD